MTRTLAQTGTAKAAYDLVVKLQKQLVSRLEDLSANSEKKSFEPVEWLRAQGRFGGGTRLVARDQIVFNRASVNISQVQYEADPSKPLASASALSAIVHPRNPFAPSMHMHISWTEMKSGQGYWRIMADLNPSIPQEDDTRTFEAALKKLGGPLFEGAKAQGERYFYIPALNRTRGVAHFYLEQHNSGDAEADRLFAESFGLGISDAYAAIVKRRLAEHPSYSTADRAMQLAYHTLYFLQVLSLDRGTTSGLLVHDENDVGILGSLPAQIDLKLLRTWLPKLPPLQQTLIQELINCFPNGEVAAVEDPEKAKIAKAARNFYRRNPGAEELLARGDSLPPTQANHSPGKGDLR